MSKERTRGRKRNNFIGAEGSTNSSLGKKGVFTGVTYQCSSPANTGQGASGMCSPDPNIHCPLNALEKETEQESVMRGDQESRLQNTEWFQSIMLEQTNSI